MDTVQSRGSRDETLNDSWVELHFQQGEKASEVPAAETDQSEATEPPSLCRPLSIHNGQMEKLLLEAQKESSRSSSRGASTTSSRGSPKSPHSPNNEFAVDNSSTVQEGSVVLQASDWIWDWSSRPEAHPPSNWGSQFKHPKRSKLSVRNTRVMRGGVFCLENLPTLLLTHACTFLMGAAVMFMYLKKYCNWAAAAAQTLD